MGTHKANYDTEHISKHEAWEQPSQGLLSKFGTFKKVNQVLNISGAGQY